MKNRFIQFILPVIFLCGCNLPGPKADVTATASDEEVATEVAMLLTVMPTTTPVSLSTEIPTQVAAEKATFPLTITPTLASTEPLPSPTLSPTATSTPTTLTITSFAPTVLPTQKLTPVPALTSVTGDPKSKLGTPTWIDNMDTESNWSADTDKFTTLSFQNDELVLEANSGTDGWRLTWPVVQDFYLEAKFKTETCSGSDHYGIIFRIPDKKTADKGYLYGFTCDGKYSLKKWDGEHMTNLIPWTVNSAIQAGSNATNRLGLLVKGAKITLYANGVYLSEAQDTSYTSEGGLGIFIGQDETEGFTIRVDDFAYWENPNL